MRQEDTKFRISPSYMAKCCPKNKQKRKGKKRMVEFGKRTLNPFEYLLNLVSGSENTDTHGILMLPEDYVYALHRF